MWPPNFCLMSAAPEAQRRPSFGAKPPFPASPRLKAACFAPLEPHKFRHSTRQRGVESFFIRALYLTVWAPCFCFNFFGVVFDQNYKNASRSFDLFILRYYSCGSHPNAHEKNIRPSNRISSIVTFPRNIRRRANEIDLVGD